jgi:hypothetical protein
MLNPDYRDLLSAFSRHEVEYLLVGAYAMAAHGQPRATMDIDLWLKVSPENARRAVAALEAFGAPADALDASSFERPGTVVHLGVAPRRIDLLTRIDGVEYAAAAGRAAGRHRWARHPDHRPGRPDRQQARHGTRAGPRRRRSAHRDDRACAMNRDATLPPAASPAPRWRRCATSSRRPCRRRSTRCPT